MLNTDNRLMSGVTLTDEYAHAASLLGFTFCELAQVRTQRLRERLRNLARAPHDARRLRPRAAVAPLAGVSANEEMVARAAEMVRGKLGDDIATALVLGSGLGGLADRVESAISIPYRAIPGFPPSNVPGHAGRFVAGTLGGRRVIVAAGRYHLYEGHPVSTVALPTRVLHACGVRTLFVSNAAGGINHTLRAGDLMIIEDHLNLMSRTPLAGPQYAGKRDFPTCRRRTTLR